MKLFELIEKCGGNGFISQNGGDIYSDCGNWINYDEQDPQNIHERYNVEMKKLSKPFEIEVYGGRKHVVEFESEELEIAFRSGEKLRFRLFF